MLEKNIIRTWINCKQLILLIKNALYFTSQNQFYWNEYGFNIKKILFEWRFVI